LLILHLYDLFTEIYKSNQNKLIMKKILSLTVILAVLISSCHYIGGERVRGNGVLKTEQRQASSFTALQVSGSSEVRLRQDSVLSVKVEGDENLLPYIEVYNEGNRLVIRTKRGYNLKPRKGLVVYVSSPAYNNIIVSGAGEVKTENSITNAEKLNITVSGAGEIKMDVNAPVKGKARDFDLEVSGAGNINCYDLLTENTNLQISGAGDAKVYASVKLTGSVSGAGDVTYKGNPAQHDIRTSGAGSVTKVD
jgi:hypothetical protein